VILNGWEKYEKFKTFPLGIFKLSKTKQKKKEKDFSIIFLIKNKQF
jgi:hypothetical protein